MEDYKLYAIGGLPAGLPGEWSGPEERQVFQIIEGNSDRQWYEARANAQVKPIGRIRVIIPEGPDHPNAILDACIAVYPSFFAECPTLSVVEQKLQSTTRLDFHLKAESIPPEWNKLREEARPFFDRLDVYEVKVTKVSNRKKLVF